MLNEIIVKSDGTATVCGPLAVRVWDYCRGEFPRNACGENRFFVISRVNSDNIIVAAQPTLALASQYLIGGRVLVSIEA